MEIIISRIIAYMFLAIMVVPMVYAVVSAFNRKYKTRSKHFLDRVVEIYMLETFGRVDRFIQHSLPVLVEKWGEAVVRIIAKFLAAAITIFLILHEFPDLLDNLKIRGVEYDFITSISKYHIKQFTGKQINWLNGIYERCQNEKS